MAKKKKKNTPKKSTTNTKNTAPEPKKKSRYPLLALLAGGVLVLAGGAYYLYQGQKQPAPTVQLTEVKNENINLREKRPTLPPEQFSGRVREAYSIARTIPEVLDKLYCYCRCKENFGHKSLLSCYVDTHAST